MRSAPHDGPLDVPPQTWVRSLLRVLWRAISLPVILLLGILHPFVSFILGGFATLGILTALFYRFVLHVPKFHFWTFIGISLGCALALLVYQFVLRFLTELWHGSSTE